MQPSTSHRFRVTVVGHRRGASGIAHVETVRAESPEFARDLVLVRVHAQSALVAKAPVGVDAVLVERLRWGRNPVRELDSRRFAVVR